MEGDFGDVTFGDPASCGGYSKSMCMSEDEDSDDDYQTPKHIHANIVKEHPWSRPTQTSDVSSTSASSASSAGCAVLHLPLDLAKMFAEASCDSAKNVKTDSGNDTRYSITECPPIDGSSLEEQLDWVFEYAMRIDKPWLNFPYTRNNRRYKSKKTDFSFLIRQYLDDTSVVWTVKTSSQLQRTAFDLSLIHL